MACWGFGVLVCVFMIYCYLYFFVFILLNGYEMFYEYDCLLCGSDKKVHEKTSLNGHPTCKKCFYKFVNRRQLAFLMDFLIITFVIIAPLDIVLEGFLTSSQYSFYENGFFGNGVSWGGGVLSPSTIIVWLIIMAKDSFGGRSLGKMAAGLQVVDNDTFKPAGFGACYLRNLILVIPLAPLIIGLTLKGRRWGDGIANTRVIWLKYKDHRSFSAAGHCDHCGYDLQGNMSGNCPECGRATADSGVDVDKKSDKAGGLVPLE